jgi:hypothetical protein
MKVRVADAALAQRIERAIAARVAEAEAALPPVAARVVRLRTRRRLAELGPLDDAVVVLRVTRKNARHLLELAQGARAAGALGVQLVWDGEDRPAIERHVFAVLEHARDTRKQAPIVLAREAEPVRALTLLIAQRRKEGS